MAKPKSRDETTTARNSRGKRPRKPARARKSTSANRPRAAAPRRATRLPDAPSPLTSSPVGSIAPRIDSAPTILRTALPAIDWADALAPQATTPQPPLQQEMAQPIRRHLTRIRERQRERVARLARIVAAALLALPGRIALLSVRVLTVSARAVTHALHPAVRTLTSVSRTAVAMGLAAFSVAVVVGAWLVFYFWVLAVPGATITAAQPEPTSSKQFYDRIAPAFFVAEPPAAAAAPMQNTTSDGVPIKDTPPADSGSSAQASAAGAPEAEMPTGTVREAVPAPVVPKAQHHKPGRAAARGPGKSKRRAR